LNDPVQFEPAEVTRQSVERLLATQPADADGTALGGAISKPLRISAAISTSSKGREGKVGTSRCWSAYVYLLLQSR
jgi:hypothetical protein